MRIALLTTDNREQNSRYNEEMPTFGTAPAALLQGFANLDSNIEIHVISCSRRIMNAPLKLEKNIWFHQPIVSKPGWGRSAFLGCGLAVRRALREISPDLVHAQGTERDCGVSMMMCKLPRLLTIHGHMARIAELTNAKFPSYYWMAKNLERMAIRKADGVVCITNYTKERVRGLAKQDWIIPNAVDREFFEVNARPNGKTLLCIANVCPWKRQNELITCLDSLADDERPQMHFVGNAADNEYANAFRNLVSERGWCTHLGNLEPQEIQVRMQHAAGLILPSIEDNCPMVLLEAMAAGIPVAGSNIGGIPDIIQDGSTGFLFDPHNTEKIQSCVVKLAKDPKANIPMSERAKALALERFHPDVVANQHLEIYRSLISKSKA